MKSNAALTAKNIRLELKAKWPTIKFSVKSESYSGGSSVDVNYTDGPTSIEVQSFLAKHVYGRFDGMQDIYEYNKTNKYEGPKVKYLFANREISQDTQKMLCEKHNIKIEDLNKWNEDWQQFNGEIISQKFFELSFVESHEAPIAEEAIEETKETKEAIKEKYEKAVEEYKKAIEALNFHFDQMTIIYKKIYES